MSTIAADRDKVTFSFGRNWKSFLKAASREAMELAERDIGDWMGPGFVRGKRVLDIGSGSGIHSLGFFSQGAGELVSFDVDIHSVEATRGLWQAAGKPSQWSVHHGSVLDGRFLGQLDPGSFDIVYSWGVLHHTGAMWDAVANAARMVRPGGLLWIALYVKTESYPADLALKQRYNRASYLGKKRMEWQWIRGIMRERRRAGLNPLTWNQRLGRGMDVYHDIVDWLGGLPYEVASAEEVEEFLGARGLRQLRLKTGESNNVYLFARSEE